MVSKDEVTKMMEALKKHMNCEVLYTAAYSVEDISKVMKEMFTLAE